MSKQTYKIPPASPADWRYREYKGYALACGDCVDCVVVMGKVRVQSTVTGAAQIEVTVDVVMARAEAKEAA